MATKYIVHTIAPNTYAIEEKTRFAQGLCYLLCGKEKALLIDTCFGHNGFYETVKSLTNSPIVVANTHAHLDHIGGNHYFDELWYHEADKRIFELHVNPKYTVGLLAGKAPIFLQTMLRRLLKNLFEINPNGNYMYFGDNHVFELGDRSVEALPTPGHTPGSVCFLDRKGQMLFTGDTVCEGGILLHFPEEACSPEVFLDSMKRLKSHEDYFNAIWPGHHGFPVDKSYIDDFFKCAKEIVEGTATFIKHKGKKCAKYNRVMISVQY